MTASADGPRRAFRDRGLRIKLVGGYALLLGSIAVFMYLFFPARLKEGAARAIAEKAWTISAMSAHAVSAALIFDDLNGVEEVFASARQSPDVRYIVLTGPNDDVVSAFDIAAAVAADFRELDTDAAAGSALIYRTAKPVIAAGDTIGIIYLGLSLDGLQAHVQESGNRIAAVTLLVFLVGLAGVIGISFVVTVPVGRMIRVVERVSEGDLSLRVGSTSRDEVGYLSRAFDSMVERLGAAYGELQTVNRSLEERVDERTRELRREIDERMHAEAALKVSEQRFRTMFESAGVGIALVTPDERILEVNPALQEMLGTPREELVGRPAMSSFPAALSAEALASLRAVLAGVHDRLKGEIQLRRGDPPVWAHVVASAVRDPDGVVRFAMVIFENITEQKELTEQLRQSQKLEAVGRLAGGIAHDFNNLLTTINGVADLMLDELNGAEWLREDIEQVLKAGQRAASLTQQLLAFSRRQMLQPRTLDLNASVQDMGAMLRRLIGENIQLDLRLDPELDSIRADPGQVGQVIMNLAVNSKDAMPLGGELTIETSNLIVNEAAAQRYGTNPGRHVMLAVRDTGQGMDEATKRNIFEPFFTTKEVGKGTGLGLATVYGIVKQSGGSIEVDSEPGRGTTFRIVLPAAECEVQAEEIAGPRPPSGTETLLLVEDEEAVRALVGRVLRRTGYTVIESANGQEALDVAGSYEGRIDGVVTDVIMPEMSGPQLVDKLVDVRPGVRVLYMSGYTRDEIDQQGFSTLGFGFIQKPMSPRELAGAVRTILDSPQELRRAS